MPVQTKYRKISIFYADDLSENVINLLESFQQGGLIWETNEKKKQLILNLPDKKEHYKHNRTVLQSDACLVKLDYSTKIDDSIEKIKNNQGSYDLVICDLYFGDNDKAYEDSKIGGIWPIYWAMHFSKNKKIVCKLYSGKLARVIDHIDYQKAYQFLQEAYQIIVENIEKSHDAGSWREHLQEYLSEVRSNIIPEIKLNDRVNFINYLATYFRQEHFNNKKEDGKLGEFKKELLELEKKEFDMIDGRKMRLIHLFPVILGSHFTTNDNHNFINMDNLRLENSLYKRERIYNSREERNKELERLNKDEIECENFRTFDETGRPLYGIRFPTGKYDFGVISKIEISFIQSLDSTYQIHRFYTRQRGFGYWSSTSSSYPHGVDEFNRIRFNTVIPSFEKIRDCFCNSCPVSNKIQEPLADQIEHAIRNVDESHFWDRKKYDEQKIEHGFRKLENHKLFNVQTKKAILPLTALFRINIPDFLKTVLQFREGDNYVQYEDEEFRRIKDYRFYWYCNACAVREGLKDIKKNMQGDKFEFYLLETKCNECKELIKYKIILRDFGRGIPSIARFLYSNEEHHPFKFMRFLKGFCQLTIRSKMNDFEGISFDAFTGKDDVRCPQIKKTGTEFEIIFTQGRQR